MEEEKSDKERKEGRNDEKNGKEKKRGLIKTERKKKT